MKRLIAIIISAVIMAISVAIYVFPQTNVWPDAITVKPISVVTPTGIACSADGLIVYVTLGGKVFKSINGGEKWTPYNIK